MIVETFICVEGIDAPFPLLERRIPKPQAAIMITINALTIKTTRLTTEFFLAGLLPVRRGELIAPGMPVLE